MNILLCPLSSPGFSFPAIAIARTLASRGHSITFATERWLTPLLRAQGFSSFPADTFETSRWFDPAAVALQVGHLEQVMTEFRPDVLVTSALALGPLMVGETRSIPVAVIGLLTELLPLGSTRRQEFQVAFNACRASPVNVERMRGDLYLRRGVPELIEAPHLIGGCSWEPATPKVVGDWLARQTGPIVYVHQARGFGAPGFWPLLAKALPGAQIAASTSRMELLSDPPAGALVGPVVPQAAVLARAAAVVCSGTTAVVLGALERGVPMVLLPAGGEQMEVAALLEKAGVAIVLPAQSATPEALADALKRALALDPAPRIRLQQAFATIDGPERAATWIEQL